MGAEAMQEGSRDNMPVHILWCIYLLGLALKRIPFLKKTMRFFMFWMTEALTLFHSMIATSFLRKTSSVPSGYFCFCIKTENGKWQKEKMKCLWQENNVPEATPLNTERQQDRIPLILQLFCGFFFFLPIKYFTFNLFLFPLEILCFIVRNHRTVEVRDARSLLDHLLHRSLPAENCSLWYIF